MSEIKAIYSDQPPPLPTWNGLEIAGFWLARPFDPDYREYVDGRRTFPDGIGLEPVFQPGPEGKYLWAIRNRRNYGLENCLNHEGDFVLLSGNRSDAFYLTCRFATIEQALEAWGKFLKKYPYLK
jgi:hypothetical protein